MKNFYNLLLENLILPIGSIITGNCFSKHLKQLRKYDKYTEEELLETQKEKLASLLNHAIKNSKYYSKLDLKISKNDPYSSLKKFPVLEKETIRTYTNDLLTKPIDKLIKCNSSGSSGKQTTVYLSKKEQGITQAIQLHWWNWAGYRSGDLLLQTGMTTHRGTVKKIKDILFRTKYIPAFAMDEEEVKKILGNIRNNNYSLAGYASSLYVLASIAEKNNFDVKFQRALSWGDKLFPHYRKEIKKAFRCDTYDTYGCSEGMLIAAQKDLPYMYIMAPHIYIEIVDNSGKEVADGELGHVLVTNLNSYSMPIIRYRLGDLAVKLPKDKYPEKRELAYPLLQKVIGRDTDIVKTESGKVLIVHTFTGIFEFYPEIIQFMIVQNNLKGIDIQYIPSDKCTDETLHKIKQEIYNKISENKNSFEINFVKVDSIPPTKSGKPQIIKSFLKNNL